MKIRKYQGPDLAAIQAQIVKELGDSAVVVSSRETARKNLLFGRSRSYELVAVVDEAVAPEQRGWEEIKRLLGAQHDQVQGLRQALKLLDTKLADMEQTVRLDHLRGQALDHGLLSRVHEAWRPRLAEAAERLAHGVAPRLEDWLEALAGMVPTRAGIHFRATPGTPPDSYVLVGPTGVGKTTTLAKLAARCVLQERLRVGLITLDTYRVGAVDQLREYATLLGIDLKVAFSAAEVEHQLAAYHDMDVVFIDTPGRSPYDRAGIAQVEACLASVRHATICLAVPAGVAAHEAAAIVARYRPLNPAALILTKVDETTGGEGLTHLFEAGDWLVVYLTDGQRVPEDIAAASPATVAALIAGAADQAHPLKLGGQAA